MPWVAKTRGFYYAPDVSKDPHYLPLLADTRSEIAVPISFGEELLGVLDLESPVSDAFTPEDQQLLQTLADQIATTIQNIQHYEELKQIKGFVGSQTALDWMRMVSFAWGHSIKHEVGISLVCAELARQAIQEGKYQKALKELEDLEMKVQGIKEIPIIDPLSADDVVTSMQINDIVETYLRHLWNRLPYASVHLETDLQPDLDNTVTVRSSKEWFRRGIKIVVDNAVLAMLDADSRQKKLLVLTRLVDNMVEILIRDTGPGIPEEIWQKLFKEPIAKPKGSRGAGVGLMLAKTIFEAYQGRIAVKETGPSGTLVVISLPIETSAQ